MSPNEASLREARELLPCPFCGGSRIRASEKYVECRDCAASAISMGDVGSITAWNRRATFIERTAATEPQVTHAFRNADDKDWQWLFNHLGHSGHGQFWKAVLSEALAALSGKDQP